MWMREIKGGAAMRAAGTQRLQSLKFLLVAVILLPAVVLSGCSGLVTASSTQPPPPPTAYSISGTISAAGGNGATVTLIGASNATTTANSSGAYTFTGLSNGTYTVTPSQAGYTFSPASQPATVTGANVSGINFTDTAQVNTFSITGTISPVVGGSGATVTLSGAATATTTANSSGVYTFTGLSNGTYAVTPSHAGYTFSPTSQSATVSGANLTGINFTATAQTGTFSISGTISPVTGGSGATVTLSGAAAAVTNTDSLGNYSFTGLTNGAYAVTPTNIGFAFTPVSLNVTVNGANQTGANFTATPAVTHSVALTWSPSVTTTVTGYNVYRTTTSGSNYARINSTLVSMMAYTDNSVQNTTTYYYVATSVDSTGLESAFSTEVAAMIP
jgi:hypothetical protein